MKRTHTGAILSILEILSILSKEFCLVEVIRIETYSLFYDRSREFIDALGPISDHAHAAGAATRLVAATGGGIVARGRRPRLAAVRAGGDGQPAGYRVDAWRRAAVNRFARRGRR